MHNVSNDKSIFEKCCDIVDYMLEKDLWDLPLSGKLPNAKEGERILRNKTRSPHGALGAFILLKKDRFKNIFFPNDEVKTLLNKFKKVVDKQSFKIPTDSEKRKQLFEHMGVRNIQEFFEKLTRIILENMGVYLQKACLEHENAYDFILHLSESNILVDVKSDKWPYTGNISLEIIRDCGGVKVKREQSNIGSIIKTRSDYWLVFYYDDVSYEYYVEIYWIPEVRDVSFEIIDQLHKYIQNNK